MVLASRQTASQLPRPAMFAHEVRKDVAKNQSTKRSLEEPLNYFSSSSDDDDDAAAAHDL